MNDYLHNLVARTLQLAPVVRPRLPSLFEPMAAGQAVNNSPPPETHEDGTAAGPVPGVFRTTVRPPDKEPPVKFETGSQPTTGKTIEREAGENRDASRRAISRPGELARATPQIVAPLPFQMGPEAPSIRRLIAQVAQPQVPKNGAEASTSEPEANGSPPQSKFVTQQIASSGEESSRGRRDLIETTATRARASRLTRPATQPSQTERFVAAHQADSVPAPDTTPTINVTIGRVDVRAVFPQPQAPPARRAHPAPMSLDDYLKQRSEGRK
jgi:hypothetical protein